MKLIPVFIICLSFSLPGFAKKKVSFYTEDSLKVSADLYVEDFKNPFILLFHQGNGSRGEYVEIAPRLLKLGFNCMAVDLRSGAKMNYVENETAQRAQQGAFEVSYLDAQHEMRAALHYVQRFNKKPVLLFGSSYSASLCLFLAKEDPHIKAVVACSPGEYFRPTLVVKDKISDFNTPVFVSATEMEYAYVEQMLQGIPSSYKHLYKPSSGRGNHGAKMLWPSSDAADECWLELLVFLKNFRN